MRAFSQLLSRLYFTPGSNDKRRLLVDYLRATPDPDRGWAVAALCGELSFPAFKRGLVRDLVLERVDAEIYALCYDYVGETAETVSHLWPATDGPGEKLPSLSELVRELGDSDPAVLRSKVADLLDRLDSDGRWALIKLGTGGMRIGMSARSVKQALAALGGRPVEEIERIWHSQKAPYEALLRWLDGTGPQPEPTPGPWYHPVMLAQPLAEEKAASIDPQEYAAEWKFDGIRVQLVATPQGNELYTRTGDSISGSFPDAAGLLEEPAVVDAELLVLDGDAVAPFNALQKRLNRKKPPAKLIAASPACLVAYDLLGHAGEDLTGLPFRERRRRLESLIARAGSSRLRLSPLVEFASPGDLANLRSQTGNGDLVHVEGLMLKRRDSAYLAGRPAGEWYKWKRDPMLADAVLLYAQRGHGKRSGLYSDYTFGVWKGDTLVPVGKAYFGFTDDELQRLDRWIRGHTTGRFGPVREVERALVLEVAFDALQRSPRHKSGIALRFPRIHRIRWDKPAEEADTLETLEALLPE